MIGFPKNFNEISACIKEREKQGLISKNKVKYFLEQGERYLNKEFPHRKMQDWKYFPFTKIQKRDYIFSEHIEASNSGYKDLDVKQSEAFSNSNKAEQFHSLLILNGRPQAPLSSDSFSVFSWMDILSNKVDLDSGIKRNIEDCLKKERNILCSLNNTLSLNGFVLIVKKDLKKPLNIQYINSLDEEGNRGLNVRSFVFVKESCKAQILENFYGSRYSSKNKNLLVNLQTDVFLESKASLSYIRLDQSGDKDVQFNHFFGHLEPHSCLNSMALSLNCDVSYSLNEIYQKENSKAFLKGLSLLNQKKYTEHKTSVFHLEGSSVSSQWYQSLLFDSSEHVFNGKIHIDKKAQKSDAKQLNKNHLLGERARAVTCPELKVSADDVKAFHGASVSSLEDQKDIFFYLQSRGLSKSQALHFIFLGIIRETFSDIKHLSLKSYLENFVFSHLKSLKTEIV